MGTGAMAKRASTKVLSAASLSGARKGNGVHSARRCASSGAQKQRRGGVRYGSGVEGRQGAGWRAHGTNGQGACGPIAAAHAGVGHKWTPPRRHPRSTQ
jgi:hypothetical protein